jgi:hypothetical protein
MPKRSTNEASRITHLQKWTYKDKSRTQAASDPPLYDPEHTRGPVSVLLTIDV